jgi:hypothetical protein
MLRTLVTAAAIGAMAILTALPASATASVTLSTLSHTGNSYTFVGNPTVPPGDFLQGVGISITYPTGELPPGQVWSLIITPPWQDGGVGWEGTWNTTGLWSGSYTVQATMGYTDPAHPNQVFYVTSSPINIQV